MHGVLLPGVCLGSSKVRIQMKNKVTRNFSWLASLLMLATRNRGTDHFENEASVFFFFSFKVLLFF